VAWAHGWQQNDTATKVLKNLDRMLAGLVLVRPES
jgi:hypothetical protein